VLVGVRILISSANDRLKEPQWRRNPAVSAAYRAVCWQRSASASHVALSKLNGRYFSAHFDNRALIA
jgi:hypothetical protein